MDPVGILIIGIFGAVFGTTLAIAVIRLGFNGFRPEGMPLNSSRRLTGKLAKTIGVTCVVLGMLLIGSSLYTVYRCVIPVLPLRVDRADLVGAWKADLSGDYSKILVLHELREDGTFLATTESTSRAPFTDELLSRMKIVEKGTWHVRWGRLHFHWTSAELVEFEAGSGLIATRESVAADLAQDVASKQDDSFEIVSVEKNRMIVRFDETGATMKMYRSMP